MSVSYGVTDCTIACITGHTHEPGCIYGSFFKPGQTYRNAGIFAGRQTAYQFRCLAIEPHPNSGAITAVGWANIGMGIWVVAAIEARDYHSENWSEA